MMERQPLTSDDAERLIEGVATSLIIAMSIAMSIQYVLLGLILWRVW